MATSSKVVGVDRNDPTTTTTTTNEEEDGASSFNNKETTTTTTTTATTPNTKHKKVLTSSVIPMVLNKRGLETAKECEQRIIKPSKNKNTNYDIISSGMQPRTDNPPNGSSISQNDTNTNFLSKDHYSGGNSSSSSSSPGRNRRKLFITVAIGVSFLFLLSILENFYDLIFNIKSVQKGIISKGRTTSKVNRISQQQHGQEGGKRRRNRKVVLLGPHDRYKDFGDILRERVISMLLVDRAGYKYENNDSNSNSVSISNSIDSILLGGIVTRNDMERYGLTPNKTVYSMKAIQKMSRSDFINGPYDIVFIGGSGSGSGGGDNSIPVSYEPHSIAVHMLETEQLRKKALAEKMYDCSYLFPKELLLTVVNGMMGSSTKEHATGRTTTLPRPRKNYAIVDSLQSPSLSSTTGGGKSTIKSSCRRAVTSADHVRFRDKNPIAPDSIVMVRELYGPQVEDLLENKVRNEFFSLLEQSSTTTPSQQQTTIRTSNKYVAVQHETIQRKFDAKYVETLANGLDEVSRKLGNSTIVFFKAGLGAGNNDNVYQKIANYMTQPFIIYPAEHAMKIVALISGAEAVIATNLNVRIVSFLYHKPRATWHGDGIQHKKFLEIWEAPDVATLGSVSDVRETWSQGLEQFFVTDSQKHHIITQDQTRKAYRNATQLYLESFDMWSNLLITPTNDKEDDDDDYVIG
jgi:hypothetical protein